MQQQVNRMMNAAQKIVLAMALFTGTVSEALAIVNPASFFKKNGRCNRDRKAGQRQQNWPL
ncbi:hypothetical protein [Erwinia oleae]|uniref:hypothetical protein n=1 Tax=Erwinia oleae TaxID=796334 RepID=UPI001269C3BB|nr:hypothetical protein [Erwinia oleae]